MTTILEEQKSAVLSAFKCSIQASQTRGKAEADLSPLVEATSQLSLGHLEAWERFLRWKLDNVRHIPEPANWRFWSQPPAAVQVSAWLDLCSGDGHLREKALQRLAEPAPNAFFLALALRRLNDWVPQVRAAARQTLPLIAKASDPEQVVDVLFATFPHWHSWGRMEAADKQVFLALVEPEHVAQELKHRLVSQATGPLTAIFTQACRTPALDPYLADIADQAIQPAVRARAYRLQLTGKNAWFEGKKWEWINLSQCKGWFKPLFGERALSVEFPFLATLNLAALDTSVLVRRVAGEMLIRNLDRLSAEPDTHTGARLLAEKLASDRAPSVAEQGRFALKRLAKAE